ASNWPLTPMPDSSERELRVTVSLTSSVPGQSPVSEASTETKTRPGWLHRLLGREREEEQR
ncbi:hypothetical protein, partial [Curtobacterium flaccumfaciens]|uniref:hypothetical protein n=1 Tax=Curtobacterium flaccumfaciens TaxID=2035 RepID=UPI002659D91F